MIHAAAFSILALTVTLSLSRPQVGTVRIHHSTSAVIGAVLTLAFGLVPIDSAVKRIMFLSFPILTIVSLMIITLVAEKAGVFDVVALSLARRAGGDARRLFAYLFFSGTVLGIVFTNDAAVLIFTPLVFHLIEDVAMPNWGLRSKIPFYFAVLYVGNLVGGLVISNPINIIVASIFEIQFLEYFRWMVLPAVVSIVVSYAGLCWYFRKDIPKRYAVPERRALRGHRREAQICTAVLALTLIGFFSETWTGVPVWLVATIGAIILLVVHPFFDRKGLPAIIHGVGWDVIVFVIGIFIVAMGLRSAGLTHQIGALLTFISGESVVAMNFATSIFAAVSSSIMNNHPTADMMAWVVQDVGGDGMRTHMMVYSALIGGDLGPKMLPIGSLAALMWFRILRDKGIDIPYSLYIKIGVPVTLAAIVLSVLTLNLQYFVYQMFK